MALVIVEGVMVEVLTSRAMAPARVRWVTVRRWFFASAVAMFPVLFILDEAYDFRLSPVLPGMAALVVLWLLGPFLVTEALLRWKADDDDNGNGIHERLTRGARTSKIALGVAFAWFLLWLVLS